jgi:hypothetical protein
MNKIDFYAKCDEIFKQSHGPPTTKKYCRRWGQRTPGSGRFEGYGLVRWFSPSNVHIALRHPVELQTSVTAVEAIDIITKLINII